MLRQSTPNRSRRRRKPPFGESPPVDQDRYFLYLTLNGFIDYCAGAAVRLGPQWRMGSAGTIFVFRHFTWVADSYARPSIADMSVGKTVA